ncbi:metal ABC transporter permease [Microcystis elabens FACHB-917]|nr:metal ABC transporter permease [Microcystis elabens FACHB-917]
MTEFSPFAAVITQPFMQRALLGGLLTGALGGLLGSFAVLRQLSFFSDALGHSALLGLSLGILLGLNPTLVLIPFAVLVNLLVQRSQLPTDALLNIVYSTSLAFAVVALSLVTTYKGGIQQLLFGDILGISWLDLALIAVLLVGAVGYLLVSLRAQVLVTLHADLAGAFGVGSQWHRIAFILLLAVVVAVSIKAVGVLLISAFVVIPACASRLVSRRFGTYLVLSSLIGGGCAVLGLLGSGLTNLPSGPCVVIVQFCGFLLALGVSQGRRERGGVASA